MCTPKRGAFALLFLPLLAANVYGERTKDKMYETIEASKACFRRLNGTHQVGCSSDRGGSTGAIHYCEQQSDLDFILKNGTAPPYVPVIPIGLLTIANLDKMRVSRKVSGLLLYSTGTAPEFYTHENQCPNPTSSVGGTCGGQSPIWNPHGTGLLYRDIPFPVFYVEDKDTLKSVKQCFQRHNNHTFSGQRDRSLCSLQLSSFMYASKDTPTCIRRSNAVTNLNPVKFCDPLGDQNVFAPLFPLHTNSTDNTRFIIVAARIDSTTMFDQTAGAISPITGLVTLLATAKLLKTMLPTNEQYGKNVLFVLFNGETYDYIGSQRFVYELLKGNFPTKENPISIDDIGLFLELSQLSSDSLVAHYLKNGGKLNPFLLALRARASAAGLNFDQSEDTLPPASVHSFIRNQSDFPGVVLADHGQSYTNCYYHSVYDNASNLGYEYWNLTESDVVFKKGIQTSVSKVAEVVAKSLYQEITGKAFSGDATVDLQLIDELFHCYLENANCRVHQALQNLKLHKQVVSNYVGVEVVSNFITRFVGLTLGWLTGDVTGEANGNCTNEPRDYSVRYYNMSKSLDELNTTQCFRIRMNYTEAVSPAFIIDGYDWTSGEYSTWAESTWGNIDLRLFLKPSAAHENMTIAIGSMVFIFSLIAVYFIKSRSHILFVSQVPTLAPTNC